MKVQVHQPGLQKTHPESGLALFYIFLAVALFAALGYAFSQGMRGGQENLTEEEAKVYAQSLLSYVQRLNRGVTRVQNNGCPEADISFYLAGNTALASYLQTPQVENKCRVFNASGGAISWQVPSIEITQGSPWIFTGNNRIPGVGTDTGGSGNELLTMLIDIDREVCLMVNELVGVTNTGNAPPEENDDVETAAFTGDFPSSNDIATSAGELNAQMTGCFESNQLNGAAAAGQYHFYHVLLAR
jgi:hypothetical protein